MLVDRSARVVTEPEWDWVELVILSGLIVQKVEQSAIANMILTMKNKLSILAIFLVSFFLTNSSLAQEETRNIDELYSFCSRFPDNSRCQEFEPPISLEERNGELVSCTFKFKLSLEKPRTNAK